MLNLLSHIKIKYIGRECYGNLRLIKSLLSLCLLSLCVLYAVLTNVAWKARDGGRAIRSISSTVFKYGRDIQYVKGDV